MDEHKDTQQETRKPGPTPEECARARVEIHVEPLNGLWRWELRLRETPWACGAEPSPEAALDLARIAMLRWVPRGDLTVPGWTEEQDRALLESSQRLEALRAVQRDSLEGGRNGGEKHAQPREEG